MPEALFRNLDEGRLDLLLFPLPIKGIGLQSTRLFREPLWVVAPKDHRIADLDAVSRSDLEGETVLTLERGHRLHDQVEELCEAFGARLSLDYEGTSLDTIRQMIGMGMGISFLPSLYVTAEVLDDSQVVARPMRSRPPFRMIGMLWRQHAAREDELLVLAGLVRDILKIRVPEVTTLD